MYFATPLSSFWVRNSRFGCDLDRRGFSAFRFILGRNSRLSWTCLPRVEPFVLEVL